MERSPAVGTVRVGTWLLLTALACHVPAVTPVSDSLPLSGRWSQNGVTLKRRDVERMLLSVPVAIRDADASKGYRGASFAIGASLWCASAAVTAVQVVSMVRALEDGELITPALDGPILALSISSDISGLIQGRMTGRANYLLHRASRSHNEGLLAAAEQPVDRTIMEAGNAAGWYTQGGLAMGSDILLRVLREEKASRGGSIRSDLYRESGARFGTVGIGLLALAVFSYVDKRPDTVFLGLGIGLTSFAAITGISSRVARIRALRRYNQAVQKRPAVESPGE